MTGKFDKAQLYELLTTVPQGKVVTYGRLALMLGNKNLARAVGNALHSNRSNQRNKIHKLFI